VGGQPGLRPDPTAFRSITGHDPVSADDWRTAATLDPGYGESGVQSMIGATKIDPQPGVGTVYGDAFIQGQNVYGLPPHPVNLGDNRGFDPFAGPDKSRVSFMIDYNNGIAVVRQNPTHATDGSAGVHPAQAGIEQDKDGRIRLRMNATNGLISQEFSKLGESVRGDLITDPHGGANGAPSVYGTISQYPSWEVYSARMGQPPTTLGQRQQNPGGPFGPGANLPLPSVNVGPDSQARPQWLERYHPDQVATAQSRDSAPSPPYQPGLRSLIGDPGFNDYPLPDVPAPGSDGHGGITIPPANQVR
jgi:hypothetical protein